MMGELISRYEPILPSFFQSITAMFLLALMAFAAAGMILWRGKSISYNYRTLLAMLCFFAGTIALGNGFFLKLTRGPLTAFEIYEKGIITGKNTYYYASFEDAFLYTDEQASLINPQAIQQRLKVLVIELKEKDRLTYTEEHYPVESMLVDIKEAYQQFKEK